MWCSDSAQCGPLQRTIACLEHVWRGPRPDGAPWVVEKGPVDGLYICHEFLSLAEIEVLRRLFSAHHGWSMYNWGNVGRRNELASVLQRIDFGLPEMTAEGVAAARSSVQPIGELQQAVISLLEARLRAAFGEVAWGGEDAPADEEDAVRPNMLQFTRIAPGTCLGNHFDRRDKWEEGIASIAWGQLDGMTDPRGDEWLLRMQCGPPGSGQKEETCTIPPGAAYILTGVAQGRTGFCEQRKVAHNMCSCCWTHGIWNEGSTHTRESITLRAFDTEWGRDVILTAVAVEVAEDDAEDGGEEDGVEDGVDEGGVVEAEVVQVVEAQMVEEQAAEVAQDGGVEAAE